MWVLVTVCGVLLIFGAMFDVFHTLFHPARSGTVCDWIARGIWKAFRELMPHALTFAGPIAFITVVLYWGGSVVFGFALIFLPHLPHSFAFAQGIDPARYASLRGALNVSLASLITLSTGVDSKNLLIQSLMGIESVLGFGLLTAAVSWLLSIYPVFEHRRSLAHEGTLLHFADVQGIRRLEDVSDSDLQPILNGLASQLLTCRNELSQFPITYYFHEEESETALAGILPYFADVAEQNATRSGGAGLASTVLGGAVDDYLKLVARSFLHQPFTGRDDILRSFAKDHQREIARSPRKLPKAA
jgi:hypothetical protein